ncbi:amidase [Microtetraspora malaysiensis]|uniref:amidase n=1 Tax=Microtetraspora malaysiensis TaxID=161358 RepID=UPI003D8D0A44
MSNRNVTVSRPDPESHRLSASAMAELIRRRELSPVRLVEDLLERVAELNPHLHAFLTVAASQARASAAQAERRVREGGTLPPLLGVPVSVKDLEDTRGIRTTYGSTLFRDHVPERDAISVERLRRAGAIVFGKTNTPEFGLLGETRNLLGSECRNPWDLTRTVGGSSGGAAAAVAAGLGPVALGSDGAGSVVAPAAMCGVLGMKATRGRVPYDVTEPHSSLYADVGVLGWEIEDLALLFEVMSGPDARDPLSLREPVSPLVAACRRSPQGLRVAASVDLGHFPVDKAVANAVAVAATSLAEQGVAVTWDNPDVPNPWPLYDPVFLAETWDSLGQLAQRSPDAFVADARAEIEAGKPVTAGEVIRALDGWWRFRWQVEEFFTRYDALLMPVVATPAFPLGRPPAEIGGRAVRPHWTTFMPFPVAWNMAGVPEISVPFGATAEGLPLGVLVVTGRGREDLALTVAAAIDRSCPPPRSPGLADLPSRREDEALWS